MSMFIASCLFSFQIFCDFSGYSDIAIGASQTMGIKLMKNFNRPYSSKSISEFWSRWHISLSTWFKDYVYIPLGGNRVPKLKWYRNIIIVFLISGFWHGANWTFILWGLLHGIYQLIGIVSRKYRDYLVSLLRLNKTIFYSISQRIIVFILVTFAWIFFRSETIADALYIASGSFNGIYNFILSVVFDPGAIKSESILFNLSFKSIYIEVLILLVSIFILEFVHSKKEKFNWFEKLNNFPLWFRWSIVTSLILFVVFFGMFHNESEFIYFQF
jgi:alginate O-acetyltransferase complex protein AlgI